MARQQGGDEAMSEKQARAADAVTLYDQQCQELAEHFLGDDDVPPAENALRIHSLAAAIHEAVEEWCANETCAVAVAPSPARDRALDRWRRA